MIDLFDLEHRKIMSEAVVAEMVAKRAFGFERGFGIDLADDAKIGVGIDGQAARAGNHRDAMTGVR